MHLFFEKDRSRELYIIQSGRIQVYRRVGNREVELAVLRKGAVLGEMALIDGKPRSASARALDTTVVVIVDAESFYDKIKGVPPWYLSIIKMTSQKIRNANNHLNNTAQTNQSVSIILTIYYFFEASEGNPLELETVKRRLIQLLGVTHQKATSVFAHLHTFGIILIDNDTIQLTDRSAYREYCQFLRLMLHNQIKKYLNSPAELQRRCAQLLENQSELRSAKSIEITEKTFCDLFAGSESEKQKISQFLDTLCDYEMLFCKRDPAKRECGSDEKMVKLQNPGWIYMYLIHKHLNKYSEL